MLFAAALQGIVVANPVPADWRARPLNAGSWSWRDTGIASEAVFSSIRGTELVIRCVRATRQVSFSRTGVGLAPMTIATTSSSRVLPPTLAIPANDPLLDAIAFSRGRVWVDASGTMPLVMRSAPEPARAVEDCRS